MFIGRIDVSPPQETHLYNHALIAGLNKGNQWVFISPDHKALFISGGGTLAGGRLTSHHI